MKSEADMTIWHGGPSEATTKLRSAAAPCAVHLQRRPTLPNSHHLAPHPRLLALHMALPRSNYDPRRVCINPFPNVSLGKHRRTIGIYLAGGLVRPTAPLLCRYADLSTCYLRLILCHWILSPIAVVRSGELDVPRCRHPLRTRPRAVRRAAGAAARTRLLRRLATRHLFPPGDDRNQPHR